MIFTDWNLYPRGPILSPVLNENSWEQISEASSKGQGQNYWSVGDCKKVHVEGTIGIYNDPDYPYWAGMGAKLEINQDLFVFIIGFNHNFELEGSGIVFQCFKASLENAINVKNDVALIDRNYGEYYDIGSFFNIFHPNSSQYLRVKPGLGWKYTDIRYDILGSTDVKMGDATVNAPLNPVPNTLMSALPEELRSVMKPMTIYSNTLPEADGSLPSVSASVDYLPLLAEYEAGGTEYETDEMEYQQVYKYYEAIDDREEINGIRDPLKCAYDDLTTFVSWWTRTGRPNTSFWILMEPRGDDYGSFYVDGREYCYGIAPIFKV